MNFCPTTPAKLYSLGSDEFAREQATGMGCLNILIQEANSWVRSGQQQSLDADAVALALPNDLDCLVENGRVEGYLLHIEPFEKNNWFRIDRVAIARDLLLNNRKHHYELSLSRSKAPKKVCEPDES